MRFINNNRIIKLFLFLQKILLPLTDIKNPPNLPVSGMPAARVVPVPYLNVTHTRVRQALYSFALSAQ